MKKYIFRLFTVKILKVEKFYRRKPRNILESSNELKIIQNDAVIFRLSVVKIIIMIFHREKPRVEVLNLESLKLKKKSYFLAVHGKNEWQRFFTADNLDIFQGCILN